MKSWSLANAFSFSLFAAVGLFPVIASADKIDDEYFTRLRGMTDDNIDGHYELAEWCKKKEKWDLCAKQCRTVLRLDPKHPRAKLLLTLARDHLKAAQQPPKPGQTPGQQTGSGGPLPRVLTDEEVQKIRRAELMLDGSERARVRIQGRRTDREFFDAMQARNDFPYDRREFFSKSPLEKAIIMLKFDRAGYADKINVTNDPNRLKVFRNDVAALVATNCATAECHGGAGTSEFQIYGDRRPTENVAYTNYYVLHETKADVKEMIDRIAPEESLLLTYSLPPNPAKPELNHPEPIDPAFESTSDRDYRKILDWLRMFEFDRPDYGIDMPKSPKP